ncbi:MAG: hypothetical protein ACRD20_02285 [Terriglobales bacterium]
MAYLKANPDGTATAQNITGYRVKYSRGGNTRLMSFRDSQGRMRTVFPTSQRAIQAMRHARYGTNPQIVPVTRGGKP